MANSYYSVLDVESNATDKQIRDAYRRLARQHHPDVNPGDSEAEARFKRINEAYHVLSDEKRRKDYDEFGDNWAHADEIRKSGGRVHFGHGGRSAGPEFFGSSSGFGDLGDLFGQFGFGGGGARARRSAAQTVAIEIGLKEAYKGTTRTITYRRPDECSVCSGQGFRGQTVCVNCEGGGITDRPVRLEVKIPPGIDDGGKIRLKPDPATEIILQVNVRKDRAFRRSGPDLHTTVTAPYTDIVLGGEVQVPTIDGAVALKVPAGTQNGKVFRLAGKGMPKQGGGNGTLYATIQARFPESLSDEELELFKKLQSMRNGVHAESDSSPTDEGTSRNGV